MNHERQFVEGFNSDAEKVDGGVFELVSLAKRELAQIDSIVAEIKGEEEQIKVRSLAVKFKEAIYFYSKLIIASGLTLSSSSEHNHSKKTEDFSQMVERAKTEMRDDGITLEQVGTYIPIINDAIYKHVFPHGYDVELELPIEERELRDSAREDAWRLYLGLPQKYGTFDISDYQPQKGSGESKYYFKIKGFTDYLTGRNPKLIRGLINGIQNADSPRIFQDKRVMGHYKVDCGQDERGYYLSYYDKWDLDIPLEQSGLFGKPFEIYDRIYYDPNNYEPLSPPEEFPELIKLEMKNGKFHFPS